MSRQTKPSLEGEPLELMAQRLSEALSNQCISDRWNDLQQNDRHSLLAVCEWLLMDWRLLELARLSHIKENLEESPPPQLDRAEWDVVRKAE
jgi:hypothetical protein